MPVSTLGPPRTTTEVQTQQRSASRLVALIDAHPGLTLVCLLVFYLVLVSVQAAHKLLWCDELFTLGIAQQGSLASIWHALAAGADPNPPLSHWLVLQSTRLFGVSALAVRLPAILCVFGAICALWPILRRWLTPTYAALGVLAFMTTRGFDYAYDARSYAPLLAFSLAALAFWLASYGVNPRHRNAALTATALALALALSSNYYGTLAFLPIAAGEAIFFLQTRSIRPAAWLALGAGALPLLAYRPLIRHNLAEFGPHAWNRPHLTMLSDSYLVLVEGLFWPVIGLAIYAFWKRGHPKAPTARAHIYRPAPHERAAVAVLLLYPILGFTLALLGHGMISPRCVIPVCAGFAIAAAFLVARTLSHSGRAVTVILLFALVWVTARESACFFVLSHQRNAFFALRDRIVRTADPAAPILLADSSLSLPLAYYAPELRSRLVVPIDFAAIHAAEPDDSGEQNLWAGRNGIFPIRVVRYQPETLPAAFTVLARPNGWLADRLSSGGYAISTPDPAAWPDLGGVFTPLAHDDTRLLVASRALAMTPQTP